MCFSWSAASGSLFERHGALNLNAAFPRLALGTDRIPVFGSYQVRSWQAGSQCKDLRTGVTWSRKCLSLNKDWSSGVLNQLEWIVMDAWISIHHYTQISVFLFKGYSSVLTFKALSLVPKTTTSILSWFKRRKFWHIHLFISSVHWPSACERSWFPSDTVIYICVSSA